MQEFMLLFRHKPMSNQQLTPEQLQASVKDWQDWIGGIAAQGKFVRTARLAPEIKTLDEAGSISEGREASQSFVVGGNLVLKADSESEALQLAEGCPVLAIGGKVEVRALMAINL